MQDLRVGLVAERESCRAKESLKAILSAEVSGVTDFGSEEDYDSHVAVTRAAEALYRGNCDCCILLSVSGSGLQMYANKYSFVRATTIFDPNSVSALVRDLDLNMVDIPTHLPLTSIAEIALRFLDSFEERHHAMAR